MSFSTTSQVWMEDSWQGRRRARQGNSNNESAQHSVEAVNSLVYGAESDCMGSKSQAPQRHCNFCLWSLCFNRGALFTQIFSAETQLALP